MVTEQDGRTLTLRYFASVRETMGCGSERWVTQAATLNDLVTELRARGAPWHTALATKGLRMAHNQMMAQPNAALGDGDEVAFFPPVTGG